MKKKMEHKGILLFCISVIGLLIIAIIPKNVVTISNAVVNENNGDIAFCYLYPTKNPILNVDLYNKDGEKIFSKTFKTSGSYAYLRFNNNNELIVCYGKSDKKTCIIDRSGIVSDTDIPSEIISSGDSFKGWNSVRGKKSYSWDTYTYLYESPTVFHRKAKMVIINNGASKTIYDSECFKDK